MAEGELIPIEELGIKEEGGVQQDTLSFDEQRQEHESGQLPAPFDIHSINLSSIGERFGTLTAWSQALNLKSTEAAKYFIRNRNIRPVGTIVWRKRPLKIYSEAQLRPLVDRIAQETPLPLHHGVMELMSDEAGQRYGTIGAWQQALLWSSKAALRRAIEKRNTAVYKQVRWRGLETKLYHERDLKDIIRIRSEVSVLSSDPEEKEIDAVNKLDRFRGGAFYDGILGCHLGSLGYWRDALQRDHTVFRRRLELIGGVSYTAPAYSDAPGRELWSSHTILMGLEHMRNRLAATADPMPDNLTGSVIGSPKAWANLLGLSEKRIYVLIRKHKPAPVDIINVGDGNCHLYAAEQIKKLFDDKGQRLDPFSQPELITRQKEGMIVPYTMDAYVPVRTEYHREYNAVEIPSIDVIDRQRMATKFYRQRTVNSYEHSRSHARSTVRTPLRNPNYLEYAAETNLHANLQPVINSLKGIADQVESLSDNGETLIQGNVVVPRSILIEEAMQDPDPEMRQSKIARIEKLRPYAFRFTTWEPHWTKPAGTWLYRRHRQQDPLQDQNLPIWLYLHRREEQIKAYERKEITEIQWPTLDERGIAIYAGCEVIAPVWKWCQLSDDFLTPADFIWLSRQQGKHPRFALTSAGTRWLCWSKEDAQFLARQKRKAIKQRQLMEARKNLKDTR